MRDLWYYGLIAERMRITEKHREGCFYFSY